MTIVHRLVPDIKRRPWALIILVMTTITTLQLYSNNHYDAEKVKAGVVVVKNRYYYTLEGGIKPLYFSSFSGRGLEALSQKAEEAIDSIVQGGFYIDKQGTIVTAQAPELPNTLSGEQVKQAIENQIEMLHAEIARIEKQLSGKASYMGGHVEEDQGYQEMMRFYKVSEQRRQQKRDLLEQLTKVSNTPQIKLHQQIEIICNGVGLKAILLAHDEQIALLKLSNSATPKEHPPLPLAKEQPMETTRSEQAFYRLVAPGAYLTPFKGEAPACFLSKQSAEALVIVKGIILQEDQHALCTSLPSNNKMQGFPLLNRKGEVEGVIITETTPHASTTKGAKVTAIYSLLRQIGYALK